MVSAHTYIHIISYRTPIEQQEVTFTLTSLANSAKHPSSHSSVFTLFYADSAFCDVKRCHKRQNFCNLPGSLPVLNNRGQNLQLQQMQNGACKKSWEFCTLLHLLSCCTSQATQNQFHCVLEPSRSVLIPVLPWFCSPSLCSEHLKPPRSGGSASNGQPSNHEREKEGRRQE